MKKNIVTILLLICFTAIGAYAQKPANLLVMGEKVPLYCGSTGSSGADSTRLPVLFQAKLMGLTPGASYKYFARFIRISDTSSSTTTGAGTSIIFDKNGSWRSIANPDLSVGGAHDTFTLGIGMGEYTGWFGALYNNDSRFAAGQYIYPLIVLEEIGTGSPVTEKRYISDSIEVLQFSSSQSSGKGTAIYGSSFVRNKSVVLLYDDINGTTTRPVTVAYSENEGFSFSNMQTWYNNRVNGSTGAWGSVIPNTLSGGITRIESRDPAFDTIIMAHTEADGVWGSDSTINRRGGAVAPVRISRDIAPLVRPETEFINNITNVTEGNMIVRMTVRRRYGNADTTKISAFVIAGTATNGSDYSILNSFPIRFAPYGERTDTIRVQIFDDFASEPIENAAIRLNNPVNTRIGQQTTHSVNITDNDFPVLTFAAKGANVNEDHGILKVKLRLSSGSSSATSVRVVVKQKTDSTFIPAEFKLGSSNRDTTVQFAGGKLIDSLEFNIPIINDVFGEDRSDTLVLALRNPSSPALIGADSLYTLIIRDNDAAPVYQFSRNRMTVGEAVGSIKLRINKVGGNSNPSDIVLTHNADPRNAQAGSDFTMSTQLISFSSSDPDSVVITVPILNDNISEGREDAVFYIRSSFNARIGKPDTLRVTIIDNDLPEYKISKVASGKAPNYVPDSLNVHCAVRGVVYGVNMSTAPGLSFTLIDNTGGLQVFQAGNNKGYTVSEGDSILVYGRIAQSNGMAQMSQLDTIMLLGSNRTLRNPLNVVQLGESTESALVRYSLVKLANPSLWPSAPLAANTSVSLTVLTASDSFRMVIDSETDIDGRPLPSGFFHVTGLGGQNDNSSPYSSNYLLFPRRYSDISNLNVPVFSFTNTASTARENRDSSDGFTLQCANMGANQQIALVIKGGTAARNTDYQSNASRLFILTQAQPSILVKFKMNDDATIELNETVIWAIRGNAWGTLIGADSVHTVTIIDDESNSIEQTLAAARTKVYPNPASESFTVSSEEALILQIRILDLNGRELRIADTEGSGQISLSTAGLASGLYTLNILTDKGLVVKTISIR